MNPWRGLVLLATLLVQGCASPSDGLAAAGDVALPAGPAGATVVAVGDFDGSGRSDLVWRRQDGAGEVRLWLLDGATLVQEVPLPARAPDWKVVAAGDFDGDGTSDLAWRQDGAGEARLWLLEGGALRQEVPLPAPAPDWKVVAAGDFDGDGTSDLAWRREDDTGEVRLALGVGGDVRRELVLPGPAPGWKVIGAGDFDGDGTSDLAWRRRDDGGEVRVWLLDRAAAPRDLALPDAPPGWKVIGVGDLDGDGRSDLLWRRGEDAGEVRGWLLDGGSVPRDVALPDAAPGWKVIGVGDFDGDRRADLAWRRADDTGEVRLSLLAGVAGASAVSLDVAMRPQETSNWCWAASGEMIMRFLGATGPTQCEQAGARAGRRDCCDLPRCSDPFYAHPCNVGGTPDFGCWGFSARATEDAALPLGQLEAELRAGRPVAFSWGWRGGGGHVMVARGLHHWGGQAWIEVLDPWPPCTGGARSLVTYAEYVAGADHVHRDDHYGFRPVPGVPRCRGGTAAAPATSAGSTPPLAAGEAPAVSAPPARAPATDAPLQGVAAPHRGPVHATAAAAGLAAVRSAAAVIRDRVPGVRRLEDARAARAGEPLRDHFVRLDELSRYAEGADPAALLHETGEVLVPLRVRGEVRLGVTAVARGGGYSAIAIGREGSMRGLDEALATLARGRSTGERLLVRIPALHVELVAWRAHGTLMVLPLFDDARLGLSSAVPLQAARAFGALAPVAQERLRLDAR